MIVPDLVEFAFAITEASEDAEAKESCTAVRPGLAQERGAKLLALNVLLQPRSKQTIDVPEGAGIHVEIQHFVSEQVLIHNEGFLEWLGDVNCSTLTTYSRPSPTACLKDILEFDQLLFRNVEGYLFGIQVRPVYSNHFIEASWVEDVLSHREDLICWQIVEMALKDGMVNHLS